MTIEIINPDSIHNYQITASAYVDIVFSPYDGGWYVQESKTQRPIMTRASRKIYTSKHEAKRAYDRGQVKWDKWS